MRLSLILCAALLALVLALAALSYLWTPGDVTAMDIANRMKPPGAAGLLGTEHFGRDMLSMIMVGARVSEFWEATPSFETVAKVGSSLSRGKVKLDQGWKFSKSWESESLPML